MPGPNFEHGRVGKSGCWFCILGCACWCWAHKVQCCTVVLMSFIIPSQKTDWLAVCMWTRLGSIWHTTNGRQQCIAGHRSSGYIACAAHSAKVVALHDNDIVTADAQFIVMDKRLDDADVKIINVWQRVLVLQQNEIGELTSSLHSLSRQQRQFETGFKHFLVEKEADRAKRVCQT